MFSMQNFLRLMLAMTLGLVLAVAHAEEAAPATDGTSSATPYAEAEGKTLGVQSDTQRKAESGAVNYTQSRIRDAGVFQQTQGHQWRMLRNGPVTFYGGWLLMLVPAIILAFYLMFGPLKVHDAPTGKLIRRLNDTLGLTSIVVSYDAQEALKIIDYVYFIADGVVVAQGTTDEVKASNHPFVRQFIRALPDGPVPFHYPNDSYAGDLELTAPEKH